MSRYFTKTLASLEPYTPGEQLKIADIVKLNANENPYPPAPGVAAAVAAAVPGLRLYSDLSNRTLNEAIAAHWGVQPGNILCGNGSDENLLLALRAFEHSAGGRFLHGGRGRHRQLLQKGGRA